MGYETTLIIGKLTDMKGYKNKDCDYVIKIAEIDLCKSYFYGTQLNDKTDTHKVYLYHSDGDTEMVKDKYDSQLFAISPKQVLDIMIEQNKIEKYRRYSAAIPLLKSLMKDFKNENLTCVLYGH